MWVWRAVNHLGGSVYVDGGGPHLDGWICNEDTIVFTGVMKVHGATLGCCGFISTPGMDVDVNPSGRPATFGCINICDSTGGGTQPDLDFNGDIKTDVSEVYDDIDPAVYSIDQDSTYVCDENSVGHVLPVKLISFEANVNERSVELHWVTSTEISNDYFTIEKSMDGKNWEIVSIVPGAGNSYQILDYYELDYKPKKGVSYYRLQQTDYNGAFTYSNVVPVKFLDENSVGMSLFPSIVSRGKEVKLNFNDFKNEYVLVVIRGAKGRKYYSKVILCTEDEMLIALPIDSSLPSGLYLVTASSDNQIYSQKLMVK